MKNRMLIHILHIKLRKKFYTIMNCFVLVSEELTAAAGNYSMITNFRKILTSLSFTE